MLNGKELQLSKSYKTRCGEIVTLDNFFEEDRWGWKSKEGKTYNSDGKYYDEGTEDEDDLIVEYNKSTSGGFNVVTKPKHYQLFPELNIEVKDVVALLCNRLGTNGYNGAFIADFAQMLQYSMRFDEKNGKEDLEKAKEFLGGMLEKYPDVQQLKGQK